MEHYETLTVARDDLVATITFNRPDKLNALSIEVLAELESALYDLAENPPATLIVTGAGKAFVAGADISQMSEFEAHDAEEFSGLGHQVLAALESFPTPVIAAVNGFALGGGCELALACDMVLASDKARFGQPEVKLGLIPGFGGCVRLPRKVSSGMARYLIFSGEMISAQRAMEIGLVCEVLPTDKLMERARALADTIAAQGPWAIRRSKAVMDAGQATDFDAACEIERREFALCFAGEEAAEGTAAFVEKRIPAWPSRENE